MANGFFLGGAAEGIESGRESVRKAELLNLERQGLGLRERALEQEGGIARQRMGLEERGLKLREQAQKFEMGRAATTAVDQAIDGTVKLASQLIAQSKAGGQTPEKQQEIAAWAMNEIRSLEGRIGRDRSANYAKMFETIIAGPTPEETAAVEGKALAAKNKAAGTPPLKPEQAVTVENTLRDDYVKQSSGFIETRDAFTRLQSITDAPGIGDVGLLYSYMKMLDPRSTVREGEVATVQQAAGVPSKVMNLYNSVIQGDTLTKEARAAIRNQAKELFERANKQHEGRRNTFLGIAQRQGVDPRNVVIDLSPPQTGQAGGLDIPPPPDGFVIR